MSLFHPEDFHDSIDEMCDDALRRMRTLQEGHLDAMQPGDAYYTHIENQDVLLDVVEYDTVTRTEIVSGIHRRVVEDEMPDYARQIMGGAVIALARHAAFFGRGSSVIVPNHELAQGKIGEQLLMNKRVIEERGRLRLVSYELGSLGVADLVLCPQDDTWDLLYEVHWRVSLVRF